MGSTRRAEDDRGQRLDEQDLQVEPDAVIADVVHVQTHAFLVGRLDRPDTCQRPVMPGLTVSRSSRCRPYFSTSSRRDHPRADQPHLPEQDVEELRQLVEAVLAQPPADPRDARVVLELVVGPQLVLQLGSGARAARRRSTCMVRNLNASKALARHAEHAPAMEDRAGRVELDEDRDGQQQRPDAAAARPPSVSTPAPP